jgi:hypothetical protein
MIRALHLWGFDFGGDFGSFRDSLQIERCQFAAELIIIIR